MYIYLATGAAQGRAEARRLAGPRPPDAEAGNIITILLILILLLYYYIDI